jgi:hypothetical protein
LILVTVLECPQTIPRSTAAILKTLMTLVAGTYCINQQLHKSASEDSASDAKKSGF